MTMMTILFYAWLYLVASFALMLALKLRYRSRCKPLAAWFDLWVGVYWDAAKRRLYVLPLPMLGIVVDFPKVNSRLLTRKKAA